MTVKDTSTNKRAAATITGWSLIFMAITGGFSLGYAFPELFTPHKIDHLKDHILHNWGLYQLMVFGILVTLILDLIVSYTLYLYFKNDHKRVSLVSGLLRLIYTVLFGVATFYLIQNLLIDEPSNQIVYTNFQRFQTIWYSGLMLFGIHIFLTGILMKWHQKIAKVLYYLTIIAGVAYFLIHGLKLITPEAEIISKLELILMIPMILGELGLAIWLLIKGGK